MAHHTLAQLLKSAFFSAVIEDEEASAMLKAYAENRRKFLKQAGILTGSMALTPGILSLESCGKGNVENTAIIGAGIAGLNAAYQLQKSAINAIVYEASDRIGGRVFTLYDEFGKGISTEMGGEFIDTTHEDILQLVKELGLSLLDFQSDTFKPKVYYFEGKYLTDNDLKEALKPFVLQLMKDINSLPKVISYKTASKFEHFDQQSVTAYLTGIGIKGWLFNFLNVCLTREYGMEASQQSAVNFLIMFTPPSVNDKTYELFGPGHEVFKIKGGNNVLTNALYEKVKTNVKSGYTLKSISKNSEKGYDLEFDNRGSATTVNADRIILAIPFTMLRLVQINVPMPAQKTKCINEIGYGNSSKFIVGVTKEKPWRTNGAQGYNFTDLTYGCGWDSSQVQSDTEGSFTIFGGGDFSELVKNSTQDVLIKKFLPELNKVFPGMDTAYSQKTIKFCWSENPQSKAGYSSFKTGQWSTLAGWEGEPVEQIYFAGEHVSRDFQGYMNGAAQTGRVAAEMLAKAISENT